MAEELVELKVVGVSRNNVQIGAFTLLLEELNGTRRLPIVIGLSEAQSIAFRLEGLTAPRPLTHDLMTTIMHAYSIELERVVVSSFSDGVFAAELYVNGDNGSTCLDSRPSDAVAMALRTNAPIYATESVMMSSSYDTKKKEEAPATREGVELEGLSLSRLKARLQHHIDCEEYEQAAHIKKIIESRSQE